MKNTTKENKNFKIENLTFSDIESYLTLPTGLSYLDVKKQAKTISIEHSISIKKALLYILWGNGYPSIKNVADVIPELIRFNFDKDINEFGLLLENGKRIGFTYYNSDRESWLLISLTTNSKLKLTKELIRHLSSNKQNKEKEVHFLKAVKSCINAIGHDFYNLPKEKTLADVTNVLQIDIDIDKLLNNGSGTNSTLRYALASCYNDLDTSKYMISRTLLNKHNNDGLKTLKLTDESVRNRVSEYMNRHQSFGAMCIYLDEENKKIITDLIDNYCGW